MKKSFSKALIIIFIALELFCQTHVFGQQISVPPIIALQINGEIPSGNMFDYSLGPSRLSLISDGASSSTQGYLINGSIYTNCKNGKCPGIGHIYIGVSPQTIQMEGPSNSVLKVNLTGDLIKKNQPFVKANFDRDSNLPALPWRCPLQISGFIDPESLDGSQRAGDYEGTFTITVTML